MFRLFRLKNTGRYGWWVIASNSTEALDISIRARRARKIENITIVGDQTEHYESTTNLKDITLKGMAALKMPDRKWYVNPTHAY